MQVYKVSGRTRDGFEEMGTIVFNGKESTLNFSDENVKNSFESIFGKTPKDGKSYIDALIRQYRMSSSVLISNT